MSNSDETGPSLPRVLDNGHAKSGGGEPCRLGARRLLSFLLTNGAP
jgi:hypothetical protein